MAQGSSRPAIHWMMVAATILMGLLHIIQFWLNWHFVYSDNVASSFESSSTSSCTSSDKKEQEQQQVYGFVHIPKTAGTEINGELASHFERVCGNKGRSHDYYQYNERFKRWAPNNPKNKYPIGPPGDLINLKYNDSSRGRIDHWDMVLEEGLEDCDWIARESKARRWNEIAAMNLGRTGPIELHVPCRDTISHLMSMCNFRSKSFNCSSTNLEAEIKQCVLGTERFSRAIFQDNANFSLRCFNPIPIDGYLDYMSSRLQRKRVENEYFRRPSNKPRNKNRECIWNDTNLQYKVQEFMLREYEIFSFCSECLGSSEDLLVNSSSPLRRNKDHK